jgi:hypothetical protein
MENSPLLAIGLGAGLMGLSFFLRIYQWLELADRIRRQKADETSVNIAGLGWFPSGNYGEGLADSLTAQDC